jgi:hypothetical protein
MDAPEYTTCVEPAEYEAPSFGPEIFVALAGLVYAIATFGLSLIASMAALMSALLKVCEYMLHGKLVCLGGDRCAVGWITSFETVDDKSGFDKIDNDFCFNLLLAPHDLGFFAHRSKLENYKSVAEDASYGPEFQGHLIQEQPGTPMPFEPTADASWPWPRYAGYFTSYPNSGYISWDPPPVPGIPFEVPVLHCEVEGDRAHAVCAAADSVFSLIPGASSFCRWKPFGIPIGRWTCAVIAAVLSPLIFAALGIAWAAGSDDNRSFDDAGSLRRGDPVLVWGRWVYDAGHAGYNELHPVKRVQRIDDTHALDWANYKDNAQRWCRLAAEVPPVEWPGLKPQDMTPEQQTVYDRQQQPENGWTLHPGVDGCQPATKPPDIR